MVISSTTPPPCSYPPCRVLATTTSPSSSLTHILHISFLLQQPPGTGKAWCVGGAKKNYPSVSVDAFGQNEYNVGKFAAGYLAQLAVVHDECLCGVGDPGEAYRVHSSEFKEVCLGELDVT